VATVTHYAISLGFAGADSYAINPAAYRLIDVVILAAASTLVVFFLDTNNLFVAPLVGSGVITLAMAAQLYKAGIILQGISSGARSGETGKLLGVVP
jgi:hypothetical protein